MLGVPAAEYGLATYQGETGVVSWSFVRFHRDQPAAELVVEEDLILGNEILARRHEGYPRSTAPKEDRRVRGHTLSRVAEGGDAGVRALHGVLARDEARNARIVEDVRGALAEGRSPLVLTERREHLELLAERLRDAAPHVVVLRGGDGTKRRRTILDELATIPRDAQRPVLATGRYGGERFDDVRLDTLFLVMPVSWKGAVVQYAGRLLRRAPGRTEVRIHDYVDALVPLLARMAERRLSGYRAIGFEEESA